MPLLDEVAMGAYREALQEHFDATCRYLETDGRARAIAGGRFPMSVAPVPLLLGPEGHDLLVGAASTVTRAMLALIESLPRNQALRSVLGLTPRQEALVRSKGRGPIVLYGRMDLTWTPAGEPRVIELNPLRPKVFPFGAAAAQMLGDLLRESPAGQAFERHWQCDASRPLERMFQEITAIHAARGGEGLPYIAAILFGGTSQGGGLGGSTGGIAEEPMRVIQYLASRGCPIHMGRAEEARYSDGRLLLGKRPVDLALLISAGGLQDEPLESCADDHPILEATRRDHVLLMDDYPSSKLLDDHALLAILSDPVHLAELDADLAAAACFVPWTRRVEAGPAVVEGETVDLISYVRARRERLVLKARYGFAGKSVTIGADCDAARWEAAIEEALQTPAVVQERVTASTIRLPRLRPDAPDEPLYVQVDPFVWGGGQVDGYLARLSHRAKLNLAPGMGLIAPVCVVARRATAGRRASGRDRA